VIVCTFGGIGSPCVGPVALYPSWEGKVIALAVCAVAFVKIWTFRFELAEDIEPDSEATPQPAILKQMLVDLTAQLDPPPTQMSSGTGE
jgi:hypothetical protein